MSRDSSNMASESSRNLVWEGRIPVCFSLHPDEIREGHRRDIGPEACYVSHFPTKAGRFDLNMTLQRLGCVLNVNISGLV